MTDATDQSASAVLEVRPGCTPAGLQCIDVPSTGELRNPSVSYWSGTFVDASLVRLALAREVLPGWTAHLLNRLETTRGYLKLGRASIHDYGREDLGLTRWQVRDLRSLGRGLALFPSLREALLAGRLTEATARRLLRVLRDDAEVASWLERLAAAPSRLDFNDAVDAAAKARDEEAGPDASREVRYERLSFTAPPSLLGRWHEGLTLARKLEGQALQPWEAVEMWAADWLAAHPASGEADAAAGDGERTDGAAEHEPPWWRREAHALWRELDAETEHWVFLSWVRPRATLAPEVEAVVAGSDDDAFALHGKLLHLVRLGQSVDFQLARVLRTAHRMSLWRRACFTPFSRRRRRSAATASCFGHYVTERLGMRPRSAYYLVELHRKLIAYPDVAADFRAGRIGWYQAYQLVRTGDCNPSARKWRERAVEVSAARLEDEVDWLKRLDALRPRDTIASGWAPPRGDDLTVVPVPGHEGKGAAEDTVRITVVGPADALATVRAALASVRAVHGAGLTDAGCFARLIDAFFASYDVKTGSRLAREHRVFHRDGWRCRMPGCRSPGPLHRHHILWRARGGGDEDDNCISLCWVHHQLVVHAGHATMAGRAPDAVTVELGVRAGRAPLSRWRGERRLDAPPEARPGGRGEAVA